MRVSASIERRAWSCGDCARPDERRLHAPRGSRLEDDHLARAGRGRSGLVERRQGDEPDGRNGEPDDQDEEREHIARQAWPLVDDGAPVHAVHRPGRGRSRGTQQPHPCHRLPAAVTAEARAHGAGVFRRRHRAVSRTAPSASRAQRWLPRAIRRGRDAPGADQPGPRSPGESHGAHGCSSAGRPEYMSATPRRASVRPS